MSRGFEQLTCTALCILWPATGLRSICVLQLSSLRSNLGPREPFGRAVLVHSSMQRRHKQQHVWHGRRFYFPSELSKTTRGSLLGIYSEPGTIITPRMTSRLPGERQTCMPKKQPPRHQTMGRPCLVTIATMHVPDRTHSGGCAHGSPIIGLLKLIIFLMISPDASVLRLSVLSGLPSVG